MQLASLFKLHLLVPKLERRQNYADADRVPHDIYLNQAYSGYTLFRNMLVWVSLNLKSKMINIFAPFCSSEDPESFVRGSNFDNVFFKLVVKEREDPIPL